MASKEKGQLPPIIMLSNFIDGITKDKNDPCKPRMSHLEHRLIANKHVHCFFVCKRIVLENN